ncbi:MAG: PaaI family thioesterase [Pseudomonadota bacterium]
MKTDEIGAVVEPELVMTASELSIYVRSVFPQAEAYGWSVDDLHPSAITVSMQAKGENLRPGGTVSGPTMFALADITAYLLVLAHIGEVALAVTTNLSINFLSKPMPGALIGQGRLLKLGKRLAVCEIHIHSPGSETVIAQATATYSIPPDKSSGLNS